MKKKGSPSMTNIILCGCNGKMGAAVQNFVNQRADCSIVAGVDVSGGGNGSFPVYTSLADVEEEAQVVVDFSHPSALSSILEYCRSHSTRLSSQSLKNSVLSLGK